MRNLHVKLVLVGDDLPEVSGDPTSGKVQARLDELIRAAERLHLRAKDISGPHADGLPLSLSLVDPADPPAMSSDEKKEWERVGITNPPMAR
jgi:hypothetical protein